MSDLIDRQAAIDALHVYFRDGFEEDAWWNSTHVLTAIEGLPSAQPERICDTCRYNGREWDDEPCESCTFGGATNHWKPSAQPEQRWISCKERLPEVHEAGDSVVGLFMKSFPVLVYGIPEYENEWGFHVVTYCDDLDGTTYWSTELDAITIEEVTAWMPLPPAYREEGDV